MKIGILTFHRALNYGAVLQCYALFTVLKEMGNDVEVIDYRPPYIEKYRRLFSWKDFEKQSYLRKLKFLLMLPLTYKKKRRATKAFDRFLNEHLTFSHPVYRGVDIPAYYDVIVFGSDQIWSPRICGGFDPIFWGQFPKGKTRFVSYAASLEGHQQFSSLQWGNIKHLLANFDSISVRERIFSNDLTDRINRPVECVMDPTLLASSKMFKKFLKDGKRSAYIFLYIVKEDDLVYTVARKVAEKYRLPIVIARVFPKRKHAHDLVIVKTPTPDSWCNLINSATCVVTNSFHATALSLIYKKELYVTDYKQSNRLKNILNIAGINDRLITNIDDLERVNPIDYRIVLDRLNKVREMSYRFIQEQIYDKNQR